MRVNREQQALAGMVGGAGLVIRLRGIPEVDQHAVLIGEVIHEVAQVGIVQITEEVWTGLEAVVVALVCPVLNDIILAVQLVFSTGSYAELVKGPASVCLGAIER